MLTARAQIHATVARFRAEGHRWLRVWSRPKAFATVHRCGPIKARKVALRNAKWAFTAAGRVVLLGTPRSGDVEGGVE